MCDEDRLPADRGAWSDHDLLAGIRAGDSRAADVLFARHHAAIRALVWSLLGADPDHEDLVQQTLMHMAVGLRRVRDGEALRSWIRQVTVTTVRKEIRRRSRWRWIKLTVDGEMPEIGDSAPGHPERPASPEARAALARFYGVLGQMRPDDRMAFTLRYVEDMTVVEVARSCGWSESKAKRRVAKATERFWARANRDFWLATWTRSEPTGGGE